MKFNLLAICIIFSILACKNDADKKETGAWFGGEIINPNSPYIILTKNENVLDTIPLDSENRFLHYLENVEKGIYSFIHNEYQILYLEPGDSLMVRVNTVEFDESLAFTGKGAERNNFLINMFLYNETENQKMSPFYKLPVNEFLTKLDSMRELRHKNLNKFIKKNKPCKSFNEIAEANIDYDYFTKREIYPYAFYGSAFIENEKLPENYYNFRDEIDYNNENLLSYYTYYRFLLRHFDYLAHNINEIDNPLIRESVHHVLEKLNAIDSLVNSPPIKNSLLRTSIRSYIIRCKNPEDEKMALDRFYALSSNENHKAEIKKISEASLKLMPGNKIPNLALFDFNDKEVSLNAVLKEPSIIYFWSVNSVNHYKNVHSKVDELKLKYPEFNFIAINTNDNKKLWQQIINRQGFEKNFEFRFVNPQQAMDELVVNTISKVMIVDADGVIIDNHTNLFGSAFECTFL
ncbi:hypothetical protein [uncultured Planktosalinus sp.]|uniref:TlpA family protein disulfide reductase n=1 Tax=uncultured Planktosalinus sp. TaxID=1810935 RepID=UPI0030DC8C10